MMESKAKKLERYAKKLIGAVGGGIVAVIGSSVLWTSCQSDDGPGDRRMGEALAFLFFIMPTAFVAGAIAGLVMAGRKRKPLPEQSPPKIQLPPTGFLK
jgi:hypothetical protein